MGRDKKLGLGNPLHHVASFNLFIEPNGKLHVTVSGGSAEAINTVAIMFDLDNSGKPMDTAIQLLKLAEELKP
jgi:hypothetical protein